MVSPRVVCVVGMHRAGTSALTRGLSALGIGLGDNLLNFGKCNPKGFFENKDIIRINQQLLEDIGRTWSSVGPIEAEELSISRHSELFAKAVAILNDYMSCFPIWGFKDPRTARLLPFWNQVFDYLGLTAAYIISLRTPFSVARSLQQRDGFPEVLSYAMWMQHYHAAFKYTRGKPMLVVDYDLLLADPEAQLRRVALLLGISLDQLCDSGIREYCVDFLDQSLCHSSLQEEDAKETNDGIPLLWEFYRWSLMFANDERQSIDTGDSDFLASVKTILQSYAGLLGYVDTLRGEVADKSILDAASRLETFLGTPRGRVLLSLRILPRWMQRMADKAKKKK